MNEAQIFIHFHLLVSGRQIYTHTHTLTYKAKGEKMLGNETKQKINRENSLTEHTKERKKKSKEKLQEISLFSFIFLIFFSIKEVFFYRI